MTLANAGKLPVSLDPPSRSPPLVLPGLDSLKRLADDSYPCSTLFGRD
jgi:hypothetical protein